MTRMLGTEEYEQIPCRLQCRRVGAGVKPAAVNEVFGELRSPSILGGNAAKKDADGFSYWGAEPKEIFEFKADERNPFAKLRQVLGKYKLRAANKADLPKDVFAGGWVGYFSYELGRYIEKLPERTEDDLKMPLIRLCFYDRIICYDHKEKCYWLIVLEFPDEEERADEKLDQLERLLSEAQRIEIGMPQPANIESIDVTRFKCNMDKDYYGAALGKIKRYIHDGIVYQVNFSQRFECEYEGEAIDLYHWQNRYNPSGYAAYIDAGDFSIVSASPEMFITVRDGIISTKPIKGTRPRAAESENSKVVNQRNFNDLLRNEKEQAELNMIIDLERNDVAKICEPGSRKVVQPRTIETYPTVYHAVATVAGRLRSGVSFCDVLKATFPGGSITGAPKVSAMEIIDETEPTARGVYTGSVGYIGLDGSVCLNIAIRTIIIRGKRAYVQVGGGIVADSEANAEYEETITKARALLAGIKTINSSKRSVAGRFGVTTIKQRAGRNRTADVRCGRSTIK